MTPRSFTRPQIPYCHSERAQRAEESCRRAKAAGEENLCRLFPAAGAAVAARPAIWRAALPTNRTPFVTKNPLFWSQNFQQTPFVPRNGCFWVRTPRRPCPMKGCGKGSKEEKIADQVGNDERVLRHRRRSRQARRLQFGRCGGLSAKALLAPDCCSQPRREGEREKQNRSRYESLNPPTPARESAAVGRARCPVGVGHDVGELSFKTDILCRGRGRGS